MYFPVCVYNSWAHYTSYWFNPHSSQYSPSSKNLWTTVWGGTYRRCPTQTEVAGLRLLWYLCFPVSFLSKSTVSCLSRTCGCIKSCISDIEGSTWFQQRYDPTQQPVLRSTNNIMDPDSLRWWMVRTICLSDCPSTYTHTHTHMREPVKNWSKEVFLYDLVSIVTIFHLYPASSAIW